MRISDMQGQRLDLITLDAARERVLAAVEPVAAELVPLAEAAGRVLAEPIHARGSQPPADLSAMDGYAVRAVDLAAATAEEPVALAVIGLSRAGGPTAPTVGPGQAVRIATGACVPAGATAVVMQESCERVADDRVLVRTAASPGDHIRPLGEEYRAGELLLPRGSACTPAVIGLLASDDRERVAVFRRPRVGLLSIGDELADAELERRDINQPMLGAACEALGARVVATHRAGDTPGEVAAWIAAAAAQCDLLISSGSASVGDYDVIGAAWRAAGIEVEFRGVRVRPGKPCWFGRRGGLPVFALPGNPLAALTGFEEFVAPALARLAGADWPAPPRLRLPLAEPLHLTRDTRYLLRLPAGDEVYPPARQGSAPLRQAASAAAIGDWQGPGRWAAGWPVEVRPTPASLAGAILRPTAPLPAVVGVGGDSGSGKTRLIEQLTPRLVARGLRVGAIKHADCAVGLETPGKDSARHAAAGAVVTLVVGPNGAVLVRHGDVDQRLGPWLEAFAGEVELVLAEGFKATPLPRISVLVGDDFELTTGQADGWPRWTATRPAGDRFDWPDELLDELAAAVATVR